MLPHEAQLEAGAATENVTPDGPVQLAGYGGRENPSTGAHDEIFSTALVLDDGAVTVGLAAVDVLNVSRELTARIRRTLADEGIEFDELLLAASHTHAGPYVPARALDVSPVLGPDVDVSEDVAELEAGIVRSIRRAHERREPARIAVGHAEESTVPNNRRASGGVAGFVRVPHGPLDPEIAALDVETASGDRTVVYNFACHPVCTTGQETLVSADWPGYARERIESELGARALFLNGAAGDINPSGRNDGATSGEPVYEFMEETGIRVGDAVVEAVENAGSPIESAPIHADGADLRFSVKETPPVEAIRARIEELEAECERLSEAGDDAGYAAAHADLRYAGELLNIAEWDATCLPNRVPYVEFGDVGVLGMPGEIGVRHGLRFKDRARVSTLLPAGYVNDYVGYVPTLGDLEHTGYEVRTMKVDPDAIVEFREAGLDLVDGGGRPGAGGGRPGAGGRR